MKAAYLIPVLAIVNDDDSVEKHKLGQFDVGTEVQKDDKGKPTGKISYFAGTGSTRREDRRGNEFSVPNAVSLENPLPNALGELRLRMSMSTNNPNWGNGNANQEQVDIEI